MSERNESLSVEESVTAVEYRRATHVSVITSWFDADLGSDPPVEHLPPSMFVPLREGFSALDLYFMNHTEMEWFRKLCRKKFSNEFEEVKKCPTEFIAGLEWRHLRHLADELKKLFHSSGAEPRQGIVTWRPRIVALATFFPRISSVAVESNEGPGVEYVAPEEHQFGENQEVAVRALRRSLHLAYLLRARVVEIVGGAGVPRAAADPDRLHEKGGEDYEGRAAYYRKAHLCSLAQALVEAYIPRKVVEEGDGFKEIPFDQLPPVAVELEPGASFLLNDLDAFVELRTEYEKVCERLCPEHGDVLKEKLTLNLDLAHAFILGYKVKELREKNIRVGHVHASDHAAGSGRGGSHASDLVPGKFHAYEEFRPWLDLVVNECSRVKSLDGDDGGYSDPNFSGHIGIELEACNQVEALHSAMSTLRRWVQQVKTDALRKEEASNDESHGFADRAKGFVLTVDIGNSTTVALNKVGLKGARELGRVVDGVMTEVYRKGGSIISFGGDGFIAFFETGKFTPKLCKEEGGKIVKEVLQKICREWKPDSPDLNLRVALHFGDVWFISHGAVRNQSLSQDIVTSVRLCDEIKRSVRQAKNLQKMSEGEEEACTSVAITQDAYECLPEALQSEFVQDIFPVTLRDGKSIARKIWFHKDLTTVLRQPT